MEELSWNEYIKELFGKDYLTLKKDIEKHVYFSGGEYHFHMHHMQIEDLYQATMQKKAYDEKACANRQVNKEFWESYGPLYQDIEVSYKMKDEKGLRNAVSRLLGTKLGIYY